MRFQAGHILPLNQPYANAMHIYYSHRKTVVFYLEHQIFAFWKRDNQWIPFQALHFLFPLYQHFFSSHRILFATNSNSCLLYIPAIMIVQYKTIFCFYPVVTSLHYLYTLSTAQKYGSAIFLKTQWILFHISILIQMQNLFFLV